MTSVIKNILVWNCNPINLIIVLVSLQLQQANFLCIFVCVHVFLISCMKGTLSIEGVWSNTAVPQTCPEFGSIAYPPPLLGISVGALKCNPVPGLWAHSGNLTLNSSQVPEASPLLVLWEGTQPDINGVNMPTSLFTPRLSLMSLWSPKQPEQDTSRIIINFFTQLNLILFRSSLYWQSTD